MDSTSGVPQLLPLKAIVAGRNPREYFDPAEMAELIESVRVHGVAQAILVRPLGDGRYELIAGERRVRAARAALGDEASIPALVRECSESEADLLSIIENTERANMSATEEAEAAHRVLLRCKGDRAEAAALLGWAVSKLARRLALMNLTEDVRKALTLRQISLGHAELLAAVAKERQNAALAKIIEHNVPVAQLKAQVAAMANDLSAAPFAKDECADCRFNSAQQRTLFAEAVKDGVCTNPACFEAKTEAHLEGLRATLAEEVPKVIILRQGGDAHPIKLCASGRTGVGDEQFSACRACANYGATVSAVVGSVGEVERDICFDAACNVRKVAAHVKAAAPQRQPAPQQATGQRAAAKGTSATAAKPRVSVGVPAKVKEYAIAQWRKMAAKDCYADADKGLRMLAALALAGQSRCIDAGKLGEVLASVLRREQSVLQGSVERASAALGEASADQVALLLRAAAASAFKSVEPRHLTEALRVLAVDVAAHWRLNAEYLELLTKSEIEAVAAELGLDKAMGDKAFKKALSGKKDEAIKALLCVEGFAYEGAIPAVMRYDARPGEDDDGANGGGDQDHDGGDAASASVERAKTQGEAVAV